ncbi:MAG: hypothetical protein HYV07_11115 [Deltaproteobacteria bacterium]|nr:hypothetical protein [Deltaproteobacteria bacterium]
MLEPLALLLILAQPAGSAEPPSSALADTGPWFDRASCKEIVAVVLSADFARVDSGLQALERSRDPDDGACAVWSRLVASELNLAVNGRTPENLEERRRRLTRMFQFARTNQAKGTRFADLEIEARTRRVRVLMDDGDRTGALSEARRTRTMLADRKGEPTPTLFFTKAVINLAIAYESWPMRTLLGMAGLEGDPEIGKTNLMRLVESDGAYRYEGTFVAWHFAHAEPKGALGGPLRYSSSLSTAFPTNAELATCYAKDLLDAGQPKEARAVMDRYVAILGGEPARFGPRKRAQIFGLTARAALDLNDPSTARAQLERARKEGDQGLGELLAAIAERLPKP